MDLSRLPIDKPELGEKWVERDIYDFPIIYEGTEQWIRDTYPNFPEEYYPILAMRNYGMSWQTYKKLLRQERKKKEKIERKRKKQIPVVIRTCQQGESIKF